MTSYMVDLMQCPSCACRFTSWGVASCNTLDAKFYTDGYVDGPMYDDGSQLLVCPGCSIFLWRKDLPTMESVRDYKYFEDQQLRELPNAVPVRGHRYEEALREALWSSDAQEKYIRIRAWWSFNRGYRGEVDQFFESAEDVQTFHELVGKLDPEHPDQSLLAQIHKEIQIQEAQRKEFEQRFAETYLTHDLSPPRELPPDQAANLERLLTLLDHEDAHESIMHAEALRELGRFDECLRELDHAYDKGASRAVAQIRQLAMNKKRRVELLE